jgi:hypothetical protein
MPFLQSLCFLGSRIGRSLLVLSAANLLLPSAAIGLVPSDNPDPLQPMQLAQSRVQVSPGSGLSITVSSDEDALYNSSDRADSYYIDGRWYSPSSYRNQYDNRYYDSSHIYRGESYRGQYGTHRGDRYPTTIIRGDIEDSTLINPIIIDSTIDDSVIIQPRFNNRYPAPSTNRTSPSCRVLAHRRAACQ